MTVVPWPANLLIVVPVQNLGQTKLGDDDEAASMQCSIAEDNNNNEKPKKRWVDQVTRHHTHLSLS